MSAVMAAINNQAEIEKISGRIDCFRFKSEDTGWGVLGLIKDNGGYITCVGDFSGAKPGDEIDCFGAYCEHEKYGHQFKVSSYAPSEPKNMADEDGVINYLSRYIGGVGKKTAQKIWDEFKEDTLDIIKNDCMQLTRIRGISEIKARKISRLAKANEEKEKYAFLEGQICAKFGVGPATAAKIRDRYGENTIRIVEENPYRITEIDGIGFLIAERIAEAVGIPKDSKARIRAGILYTLSQAELSGHTRLPHNELVDAALSLLNTPELSGNMVLDEIRYLAEKGKLLNAGDIGYGWACIPAMARAESQIAEALITLSGSRPADMEKMKEVLGDAEKASGISLNKEQETAVFRAVTSGVSIVTGGPGTGKTTVINEIIRCFEAMDEEVLLCAPTGRAAKRMSETSGRPARTIHRALEFRPNCSPDESEGEINGQFNRNAANPFSERIVVVDETSMVDVRLAAALLDAVAKDAAIVFVGDADQLPSVGPGSVFRDMIASGLFPVTRLHAVYRQDSKSSIVRNSVMINQGEVPKITNDPEGDFFCISVRDEKQAAQLVVNTVSGGIKKMGISSDDIQVLAPMRKGQAGVTALNVALREKLNPPSKEKLEITKGDQLFREGDRVMQVKNNYKMEWTTTDGEEGRGVFNGDTGIIEWVDPEERMAGILFDDGHTAIYEYKDLDELEPAWAITIHKSQGSEYSAVVIPLLWGPPTLLTRGLLYTAITRAKKCVIIIGYGRVFAAMTKNGYERKRYTGLQKMLLNEDYFMKRREEKLAEIEEKEAAKRKEEELALGHKKIKYDPVIPGQEILDFS